MNAEMRGKIVCLYPNAEKVLIELDGKETDMLLLHPLKNISDADIFHVTKLMSGWKLSDRDYEEVIMFRSDIIESFQNVNAEIFANNVSPVIILEIADYLRNLSYAMPAYGYSVQQMIEKRMISLID